MDVDNTNLHSLVKPELSEKIVLSILGLIGAGFAILIGVILIIMIWDKNNKKSA